MVIFIEYSIFFQFGELFLYDIGMGVDVNFRDILQSFLQENRLTQTDFAKRVGIKPSQVCEWLKEKAKPSYDLLKQICLAFNISADYFLGLTNEY